MTSLIAGRRLVWMLVVLLFGAVFLLESVALHRFYSTRFPGISDFYAPWAGARALLLEGRDPYSQYVTAEIQEAKDIDPSLRGSGKGGFTYPLHVVFVFWPLVYLPYPWVQAIWMVTLQWLALATVAVLLCLERWSPEPLGLLGLCLGTLFLYPVARSIMLGQFTLHVTFMLAAALLALEHRRDAWAGAALGLTSIKPQMIILVVPWIALWAVSRRRWRLLEGLLGTGTLLMLGSLALFPRWPISFVRSVFRYSTVAGGRNPIRVLVSLLWSDRSVIARYSLAVALLVAMLGAWRRGWADTDKRFSRATQWTILVSLSVLFQTGTTNQAMLLIPLFEWLRKALKRWPPRAVLICVCILESALWVLFLATIKGDWENPVMFLPLPLLGLIVLTGIELSDQWRSERVGVPTRTNGRP
jgi:hypothetical protein